ncbi:hypothetical protein JCM10207_005753 [Rhodosporidiobolus poonsookiae]
MSCCCRTASDKALDAAVVVLLFGLPAFFYEVVELSFHFDELDQLGEARNILFVLAVGGGVLAAILGLAGRKRQRLPLLRLSWWISSVCLFLAMASVGIYCNNVADINSREGQIIRVGSILMISALLLLAPLAWLTHAFFHLARQHAGLVPLPQRDPDGDFDLESAVGSTAHLVEQEPRPRGMPGYFQRSESIGGGYSDDRWSRGSAIRY